jgi:hypothetical protein
LAPTVGIIGSAEPPVSVPFISIRQRIKALADQQ